MQNQEELNQTQNPGFGTNNNGKEAPKPKAGDYIDFEEVKEKKPGWLVDWLTSWQGLNIEIDYIHSWLQMNSLHSQASRCLHVDQGIIDK